MVPIWVSIDFDGYVSYLFNIDDTGRNHDPRKSPLIGPPA